MQGIEKLDFTDMLDRFRSAMVLRLAFIDGAGFFFIIEFMLFGKYFLLGEAIVFLIILIYFFLTNSRNAKETRKHEEEIHNIKSR
jgi:hypothetical protein